MIRVVARQDVATVEKKFPDGHSYFRTDFVDQSDRSAPTCYIAESTPGRKNLTHYHTTDQFQVVCRGKGTLGRREIGFGAIHFARAYTPYGPLDYGADLGFFAVRARRDEGNKIMPAARKELEAIPDRKPWQVSAMPDFDLNPGPSGVAMKAVEGVKDERGLAAYSMVMKAGAAGHSIDPSKGDGQCILVMKGGILHEGALKNDPAMIWVDNNDPPFRLLAGPQGATLLILNFPVPGGGVPQTDRS